MASRLPDGRAPRPKPEGERRRKGRNTRAMGVGKAFVNLARFEPLFKGDERRRLV